MLTLSSFWEETNKTRFKIMSLNKWELLATMQATAIYILIRLDEGETDYNNYDCLLLTTVAVCLSKRSYFFSSGSNNQIYRHYPRDLSI